MMKIKKILCSIILLILSVSLYACGQKNSDQEVKQKKVDEKKIIVVGTTALFAEVLEDSKEDFEKLSGHKLEVKMFDDIVQPNVALDEGSIDANVFQHEPFLDSFNKEKGAKLVRYGEKINATVFGTYSTKIRSLDELKERSKVGIPNDASNRVRGLVFLEDKGVIKLKEGVEFPTTLDIIENKKKIELIEMSRAEMVASLDDLDAGVMFASSMLLGGKDPKSVIAIEEKEVLEKYALIIALRESDSNIEWAKYLEEALTNERAKKFLEERFKGAIIPL